MKFVIFLIFLLTTCTSAIRPVVTSAVNVDNLPTCSTQFLRDKDKYEKFTYDDGLVLHIAKYTNHQCTVKPR